MLLFLGLLEAVFVFLPTVWHGQVNHPLTFTDTCFLILHKTSLLLSDIPIHGGYMQWSRWWSCSKSCGLGTQYRYRSCTNPPPANNGRDCLGANITSRRCYPRGCPGNIRFTKTVRKRKKLLTSRSK